MTLEEKQKFAIGEAKDFLKDTTTAISKTRDKSWQLLAFIIAIDVYSFQNLIQKPNSRELIVISLIATIFTIVMLFFLNIAIFPTGFNQNGGHPKKLTPLIEPKNDWVYFEVIMKTYQINIDKNDIVLNKMVKNYNLALKALYWLLAATVFVFFLFMFIKGNK